ncbi:MAG: molybdopterin dehydrogenase [Rhodospirillaceae bacterium]|nr:molybdopterin dehydrogenase [Rhodospirillaceae bacterium]|tara:strand:+ start:787 stop:1719 length:933 start_codon:yes stop_codon:yes gene_type:complete
MLLVRKHLCRADNEARANKIEKGRSWLKPAPFAYVRAESLEQVFDLLDEHGDEARILAGGQSLMATLNMRLSAPEVLIDINRIDGLSEITTDGNTLRIGALARHSQVLKSADVAKMAPLITQAMSYVAHQAIRNRGTFGGSIAFADPAAEMPAVSRAINAKIILQSRNGTRSVDANDFFLGLFETAMKPSEILIAVEIPAIADGARTAFMELARRSGDYAIVGIGVQGHLDGGTFSNMRLVFLGAGDRPILASAAAAALDGNPNNDETVAAAQTALDADLDPMADLNGPPEMKMHLARVLTKRALTAFAA